jgi:hypothetical protein
VEQYSTNAETREKFYYPTLAAEMEALMDPKNQNF